MTDGDTKKPKFEQPQYISAILRATQHNPILQPAKALQWLVE